MPSLAELLGYLVQPLGGPGIPALAKAPNNATAGSIPGVQPPKGQPLSSPAELMQALTAIGNAQYTNKLHEAQAEKFRAEAEEYRASAKDTPPPGYGQRTGTPAVAPDAWGSLGAGVRAPAAFRGVSAGDPVEHFLDLAESKESGGRNIMQQVIGPNGGYNPSVGRVTGPSSAQGYFQIINPTWREFAPAAGVDIEQYPNAMRAPYEAQRQVARTIATTSGVQHWTDFNQNLRAAAQAAGLPVAGPIAGSPVRLAESALPAVPNFGGIMTGNRGPSYAPPGDAVPQQMPAMPQAQSRFSPEDMAWAMRQDQRNANRGKRNPAAVEQAIAMGPGGKDSLEHLGAAAGAKKGGEFPYDAAMARLNAILTRGTNEEKARLDADLKARGEGIVFDPVTGAATGVRNFNEVTAATRGAVAGAEIEARSATEQANEKAKQLLASRLDPVPATVKMPDGSFETRQMPRSELISGVASPPGGTPAAPQTLRSGGVLAGLPAGAGPVEPGYRMVVPPSGGPARQELIPGSPSAKAGETAEGQKQQSADIMVQDIGRVIKASRNEGGFFPATGLVGSWLKNQPGSAAFNTKVLLEGVDSNIATEQVTVMRNSSPSGAALGAVSDKDIGLLKATRGSLEQAQDQKEFEFTLKRLSNMFQDIIHGTPAELERAVQKGTLSRSQFDQAIARRAKDRYTDDTVPPRAGEIQEGYRFKGGNPADRNSWERAQ